VAKLQKKGNTPKLFEENIEYKRDKGQGTRDKGQWEVQSTIYKEQWEVQSTIYKVQWEVQSTIYKVQSCS